ncbi:MAG: hypothetical protein B6D46_07845 [Polyangiaceae bacterium UTPRO1]|jgi:putative ABC transport system permease protein|nr:ABC transporter permease [Myxococcales bacterium]OQY67118.1 MAG: hypothetical protein B6D46_07845 [Polyangiaceae bacterium UTPRO1]
MRGAGVVIALVLSLAVRHLARHRALAAVAIASLAGGVAAINAVQLLHASVVRSYEETTTRFAGRAALEVTNGESGVAEELVDELRTVAGVGAVAAAVTGFVAAPDLPGERLYLYGVDLLADQEVRDYGAGPGAVVSDPMVFLAAPDSVALTRAFMRAHGLRMHDRVRVRTPAGTTALVVRAVLDAPEGPAAALDGRLAIVDLSVAQDLLRFDGRVSELAVAVAPGADVDEVAARVRARVATRGVVEPPRSRAASFARLLANYRNGLGLAAAVALVVALHFVANIAALACEERRREMALLRLAGASRRLAGGLVAAEMLVVALAAASLGAPSGIVLARALQARFGSSVAALYGDVGDAPLAVAPTALAAICGLGIALPMLAVLGTLRRAGAVRPLAALRPEVSRVRGSERGVGVRLGALLGVIAVGLWGARARLPISVEAAGMATMLGVLAALALVLPALVRAFAAAADAWARRRGRVLFVLAARVVAEERRRVAAAGAALLVGLGGTIGVGAWIASLDATLHEAFAAVFARVDLVVSGGADPFARAAVRLPGAVAAELARRPDVAFADVLRVDTIELAGSRAAIVARDAAAYVTGRRRLAMVEGDADAAARALAAGTGVLVNRTFARRFGRRPGDELELPTPAGPLRVRIAGIHLELTPGDLGAVLLDRELYRRWWHDDSASLVEVAVRRPRDRGVVAAAIRARWGASHGVVVLTVEELRNTYRALLDRLAALVRPLLGVALASALAGVLSTGAAAMLARRRVHALLRAVGLTRRQLGCLASLELVTVGAIAAGAATALGWGLGWLQVQVLLRGMLGLSVDYAFPAALAAGAAAVVLASTALGGWWLGYRAGGAPLAAALRWE